MDYSKALKLARAITGLRQKELAQLSNIDPSHISLIEKGTRKPSVEVITRLCHAMEIPDHLFTLLAAEPDDLVHVKPEELARISESLMQFVVGTKSHAQKAKRRKRSRKAA